MEEVDLKGRTARCTYSHRRGGAPCTSEMPSSTNLPFFEFLGEGSRNAETMCRDCMYRDICHASVVTNNPHTGRPNDDLDHPFVPRGPAEFDRYYCGCWGWS